VHLKTILLKISRVIGWTLFGVFTVLITVILLIRVPAIQNRLAEKAVTYLEDKIKTNVELGRIVIDFPKKIVIEGLYLEDQKKDTLLHAGRIAIDAAMMDLFNRTITLNTIEVSNTSGTIVRSLPGSSFNFDYILKAFASEDTAVFNQADSSSKPWTFSIGDVELENVKLNYHDAVDTLTLNVAVGTLDIDTDEVDLTALKIDLHEVDIQNTSITYSADSLDFQIADLTLSASDILYDTTSIEASIGTLSLKENVRGLNLTKLSGFAKLQGENVEMKDIELLYGESTINITGKGNYKLREGDIILSETSIALSDILQFQPHLLDSLPIHIPLTTKINIDLNARGNMDKAAIDKLIVRTLDSTYMSASGTTDNLNVKFYTSGADIKLVLTDTLLPVTPKWVTLSGKVKGGLKKQSIIANLATDLGIIDTQGELELPKYNIKMKARSIKAGQLSGQTALGDASFDLHVDGSGLSTKDLHTKVDLVVNDIIYNNYHFRDFKVNGTIDKFLFSGKAQLDDENIAFELNADLDYNGDIPVYKAQFDLKNLDLKELNISERPLKARLTVDVDLTTSDFRIMNGRMDIRKVGVFNGEKLYAVDSMLFASLDQEGRSELSIRSDILSGDFEGSFNIFSISEVLEHHFERYFSNGKKKATPDGTHQHFTFDLKIKNTDLLTEVLVPELEPFTPGVIRGKFDSREHQLDLIFRTPKIKYNQIGVDSIVFVVNSDAEELRYFAKLGNVVADTIKIPQINLTGLVARDSIRATLNVLDSLNEVKYRIGTRVSRFEDLMRVHLEDSLLLNYGAWNVPADNYLDVASSVIAAQNFEIAKGRQKVMLLGDTRQDPAVTVKFEELELGNFTRIISGVVPASGELNGDFKFTTSGSRDFSSKLTIAGLSIMQKTVGDLTLVLDHSETDYNIQLNLRGNRTALETKGTYGGPKGQETVNLITNISQLNMEIVQAFSMGQVTGAEGILKGNVEVNGKPSDPDINGSLTFSEVGVTSTYLNSRFQLRNETIAIRNDNITLNNFTISDVAGNKATLNGNINVASYVNPKFDLTLNTREFQVLDMPEQKADTKADGNELFYGKVKINSTARISGSAQQPKVNLKLSFTEDTNFTYVVPASEKAVLEAKGIVKFVDRDAEKDPFLNKLKASDSIHTTFAGIEVSAVIELTDKEILNIVIDPITGDKLSVQGNSSLTLDMTSSGNINLSGRYEITSGTYNFSFYNLVKQKFDIVQGSSIIWSGDPLEAQMDIRASNLVEASPLELVSNQVSSNDPAANNFNQRLPFLVYINIKGALLTPQISFALDMPADKRYAFGGMLYSKIQDINSRESDLNKQVFGLLILKRFVADNPLESHAGSTNAARTSVSRMLSEQLNRLSSNVKGIQLTADIKSYEDVTAEGAQGTTKAQLGVSKSLFGDRLVVKLSGNVDIEGEEAGSENVTDYIGDIALEYKMTADGRFRVTGFRNSNYDMIDGELTETGAGLIYIKDYNTLWELFKANEKQSQ
jgi:hypothetical protein